MAARAHLKLGQHSRALRWGTRDNFRLILHLLEARDAPLLHPGGFLGYLGVVAEHILMEKETRGELWLTPKGSSSWPHGKAPHGADPAPRGALELPGQCSQVFP